MESVAVLKSGLGTWNVTGSRGCRVSMDCLAAWRVGSSQAPGLFAWGVVFCKVQLVRLEMPHGSPGPCWPRENG